MIKVTSTRTHENEKEYGYISHVSVNGKPAELACEIRSLIQSFLDDPVIEDIYLSISTDIAKARVEDLKRTLEGLKDD